MLLLNKWKLKTFHGMNT